MTGLPDLNFPAFHAAAALLREQGHEVINPAEINADPTMGWAACMRSDIAALVTCDAVVLLPGWQASRGATLERHIALALGMDVSECHQPFHLDTACQLANLKLQASIEANVLEQQDQIAQSFADLREQLFAERLLDAIGSLYRRTFERAFSGGFTG